MEIAAEAQKGEVMTSVMQPFVLYVEDDPDEVFWLDLAFKKAGIAHSIKVVPDGHARLDCCWRFHDSEISN